MPVAFRVDKEAGIIHGARILGPISRNKRNYTPQAMADVARLSARKQVRLNHNSKSYDSIVAHVDNVIQQPDGVYGDLRLKPHHPLREQILFDAENNPNDFQLSIDGDGRVAESAKSGWYDVVGVDSIEYVALVTDGATNLSIRESLEKPNMELATLKSEHPELIKALKEEFESEFRSSDETKVKITKALQDRDDALAKVSKLQEELQAFQEKERKLQRREAILAEAKELKAGEISEELMESYIDLKEELVTTLLKDRASHLTEESSKGKKEDPPSASVHDDLGGGGAGYVPFYSREKQVAK